MPQLPRHYHVTTTCHVISAQASHATSLPTSLPDITHSHSSLISAQPDVTRTTLREGDEFMVLACDGVWDVMSNQASHCHVTDTRH